MILEVAATCVVVWFLGAPLYGVWKARRGERLYPPSGQFVRVGATRLHYVRRGDPAAGTIVLLHGSDGFQQDFSLTILDRLARDSDVIAFDRPGHGYSDAPADTLHTPHAQAALIRAALLQLQIEKPLLVGHSWSATLLLDYALDYPDDVAALTLLGGWIYPAEKPPSRLLTLPLIPGIGNLLTWLSLTPFKSLLIHYHLARAFAPGRTPPAYERQAQALWQRWPAQTRCFAQENTMDRAAMETLSPRYGEIAAPVVIVTGGVDRVVDPVKHSYRLHAAIPHARLIRIPKAGHEPHHDAPEAVVRAIHLARQLAIQPNLPQPDQNAREGGCLPDEVDRERLDTRQIDPEYEQARDLVYSYGWNATSYQILNPGITYWFAPEGDAVVGYVCRNLVRIVAGAPVCAMDRLETVIAQFEAATADAQERVCYFAAADRLYTALCDSPAHSRLPIGAQPVWKPGNWPAILKHNASLRAQLNRARNKGIAVAEWPAGRAGDDPALRRCLEEWLQKHALPTLQFLTQPVALDRLGDRRIFVASAEGDAVGFLIATPVPDRNGWLIEQIVRGAAAPNGVAELLVDGVMTALAHEGADYVTLGLAPLSQRAPHNEEPGLPWLRLLLSWVRAHGRRFYNFEGLDAFKAKFKPDRWEPIYAISNESHFSFRTLYAIAAAFSDRSPSRAVGHALVAAVRQEVLWLRAKSRAKNT